MIESYKEKSIDLKENELCIIEIKNQFPPSSNELTEKYDQNEKQPTTFFQMVKGLIKKAKIFKQLCDFKNEKVDYIRLILFHDAIQKENYYKDLKKAFEESFEKNDKSQLIYEFQCIYIKSSYLAAGLFNMFYKYDFLSYTNKSLNEKIEKLDNENSMLKKYIEGFKKEVFDKLKNQSLKTSKEILSLKEELNKSQKNKLKETSKMNEEIINYSEEIEKIKSELIDYKKKNSEEIIKLKEENNKSSAQILELKKDFAHKINEKSNEIVGLQEEINKLIEENISFRKDLLKLEKKNKDLVNNKEKLSKFENKIFISNSREPKAETSKDNKDLNEQISKQDKISKLINDIKNSNITEEDAKKKYLN